MTRITAGVKPPTKPQQAQPAQMADIALTAWLDFQLAAYDLGVIQERLKTHRQRLEKADIWFETHHSYDPRFEEARQLHIEVQNAEDTDKILLDMNAKRAMHHLWNLVLAFDSAGGDNNLWRPEQCYEDLDVPISIFLARDVSHSRTTSHRSTVKFMWSHLLPNIAVPDYDPTSKRANWVEWRLGSVPVWEQEDLREALQRRQSA